MQYKTKNCKRYGKYRCYLIPLFLMYLINVGSLTEFEFKFVNILCVSFIFFFEEIKIFVELLNYQIFDILLSNLLFVMT